MPFKIKSAGFELSANCIIIDYSKLWQLRIFSCLLSQEFGGKADEQQRYCQIPSEAAQPARMGTGQTGRCRRRMGKER